MSVKQCQFAYDSEWLERKNLINGKTTWNDIQQAGIAALEKEKGTENIKSKWYTRDGEAPTIFVSEMDIDYQQEHLRPEEDGGKKKEGITEIPDIESFEINVSDSIVDVLDGNSWKELKDHVCFPPNIVRFRDAKTDIVKMIKENKRFQMTADPKFEDNGAVYYTVKPT